MAGAALVTRMVHVVRLAALVLALVALPGASAADEPIRLPPVEVRGTHPLVPAQYRSTPLPPYPSGAREQGVEGTVLLDVRVQPDGRVGEVRLKHTSGSPLLDGAALETVKAWTFVPARRGPATVESWVEIPVRFSLTSR